MWVFILPETKKKKKKKKKKNAGETPKTVKDFFSCLIISEFSPKLLKKKKDIKNGCNFGLQLTSLVKKLGSQFSCEKRTRRGRGEPLGLVPAKKCRFILI